MRIECPICKRVLVDAPEDHGPRPFCSTPCKMIDLGNWLSEAYRIPVSPREDGLDADLGRQLGQADPDDHTLS
jgi:endogenous inhibitor of DNA gyrase (YacG/DUF329 family)